MAAKDASRYLGVSRAHFYAHIKPTIKAVDVKPPTSTKPMWRWRKEWLDDWMEQRVHITGG